MAPSIIPFTIAVISFITSCFCLVDTIPLVNKRFLRKPFFYMVLVLFINQLMFFVSQIYLLEHSDIVTYSRIRVLAVYVYAIVALLTCMSIVERNKIFVRDDRNRKIIAISMYFAFALEISSTCAIASIILATGYFDNFGAALARPPLSGPLATVSSVAIGIRTLIVTLNELYIILSLKKMGYLTNKSIQYAPRYVRMFASILVGLFLMVSIFFPPKEFPQLQLVVNSVKTLTLALEVYVLVDVFKFEVETIKRSVVSKNGPTSLVTKSELPKNTPSQV